MRDPLRAFDFDLALAERCRSEALEQIRKAADDEHGFYAAVLTALIHRS
jgi:hypothetical protein